MFPGLSISLLSLSLAPSVHPLQEQISISQTLKVGEGVVGTQTAMRMQASPPAGLGLNTWALPCLQLLGSEAPSRQQWALTAYVPAAHLADPAGIPSCQLQPWSVPSNWRNCRNILLERILSHQLFLWLSKIFKKRKKMAKQISASFSTRMQRGLKLGLIS